MTRIIAAAILAAVCAASSRANAETALEVQSWCKPVLNGRLGTDGMIYYTVTAETSFCWGAFAAIQEVSKYMWDDSTRLLGFCPPETSTKVQFIKIFSKYVDDHPEDANQAFGGCC
jgi:hypothetical protein